MTVHFGGRGVGHTARGLSMGRSWGDFTASAGFAESPDNTFTRNTADSWTPRVYSNTTFTGPCKMEGAYSSGANVPFGLDTNRTVTQPFNAGYCWYLTGSAGTRVGGTPRVAAGVVQAGDIYGIRKTGSAGNWTIEWYRIRGGTLSVLDTATTATDETLGVLAGAFENTASFSLSAASL